MTATWWDGQPAAVRAVLDLAWMKPEFGDDAFGRILDTFASDHVDTMLRLADDLTWAERLASEYPVEVLADYYDGQNVTGLHALDTAEQLAAAKRADALTAAQLLAEMLVRRLAVTG